MGPGCPFRDAVPRPEDGITQACCASKPSGQTVCTTVRTILTSSHQQGNVHPSADPRLRTRGPGACTRSCVHNRPGTPAPPPATGETGRVSTTRPGGGQSPQRPLIQSPPTKQHTILPLDCGAARQTESGGVQCRRCASSGREGAAGARRAPCTVATSLCIPVLHCASTKDTRNPNLFTKY